jgi:hypothetical protein
MQNSFSNFRGGINLRFPSQSTERGLDTFTPEEEAKLGPLKQLTGTWIGQPNDGWNIIFIPSKNSRGFDFEVIPFSEELTFNPNILVGAGNAGPIENGEAENQQLWGLMYEQIIKNSCTPIPPIPTSTDCKIPEGFVRACKFTDNEVIHAETGFFLNTKDFNEGLDLTRLSTIPHGNSVLLLGKSSYTDKPITDSSFIGEASIEPTTLDGKRIDILGYTEQLGIVQFPDFCAFNQTEPNSALHAGLKGKTILEMTTLKFSTEYDSAGILSIPFLQKNINTTKMTATFWIQKIQGEGGEADYWQLQYTQTIDLVFPVKGNPMPIIWPHVTVNTLRKKVK